jgi:DNA-binding SARP family transcriptional activator
MQVFMLGAFDTVINGVSVVPQGAKPRTVLALLALNAGHVVTSDVLMTELWDGNAPRSARTTLQTYILHIRKVFAHATELSLRGVADELLATHADGYRLTRRAGDSDLFRFDALTASASSAMANQRFAEAGRMWQGALAQWSGSAFGGVAPGPALESEIRRLEEARLRAMTLRIEADLRVGHADRVVSELASLTRRHPFNESFHAQYMRALSLTGRRVEALRAYQELRSILITELGLEPGVEIREVHQSILAA